ncbi:MAG: hypothetical protein HWN79_08180 [Candidatus Lokiarchaeota archaeon]|nr:hypothetical protein [Candidatus Lokiarchaeota archaeon]
MPIMSGWEVSSDRVEKFEKMMSQDAVGDPIITSKCRLGKENGFFIASDNGFAWRIQITAMRGSPYSSGKSKWVRWHDVDRIDLKKEGVLILFIKVRTKDGTLKIDGSGNPKLKKWPIILQQNKNEEKGVFRQRQAAFFGIMSDIFNQKKVDTNPPTSDSRI